METVMAVILICVGCVVVVFGVWLLSDHMYYVTYEFARDDGRAGSAGISVKLNKSIATEDNIISVTDFIKERFGHKDVVVTGWRRIYGTRKEVKK